jgi:hypothetical protein
MNRKDSPQSVIESYRRRQQMAPVVIAVLAVLLVIAGIVILVLWFRGENPPPVVSDVRTTATETEAAAPTATETPVPPTATVTSTPTETLIPTITLTPTLAGPFEYIVESGDNCWTIAVDKFKVNPDLLLAINGFAPGTCPISPGLPILIPLPDTALPTDTPVPYGPSVRIEYFVRTGETLAEIAEAFHTTRERIVADNKITDELKIKAGDKLIINTNTVTATPTLAPTVEATGTPEPTATQ